MMGLRSVRSGIGKATVVTTLAAATFGLPVAMGLGMTSAHAGAVACIDLVGNGVVSTGPCSTTPGSGGATDVAAVNVCAGGHEAQPVGVYTNPLGVVGVVENAGPLTVNVWGNLTGGPEGQAEVNGIGIADQQDGC